MNDIARAIAGILDADWRQAVDDMGLDAFVDAAMTEDGLPSWMRPAIVAAVADAYAEPSCSRCSDSGYAIELHGPDEWPAVCDCDAAHGLRDEDIVFCERAARASRFYAHTYGEV
jgi:hypothetical protein